MFFEDNSNNNNYNPYRNRNIGGSGGGSDYRQAESYVGKHNVHLALPIDLLKEIDKFVASNRRTVGTRTNAIIQFSQLALFIIQKRGKLENPEILDQLEAQFEQGTIVDWFRNLTLKQFNALDAIFQTEYQERMRSVDEERKRRSLGAGARIEGTKRWIEYKQEEEYHQHQHQAEEGHQQQPHSEQTTTTRNHQHDNDTTTTETTNTEQQHERRHAEEDIR